MAKSGQKITRGMLPEFPRMGKKPERGVCQRCGVKAPRLLKAEIKAGKPIKICESCLKAQGERAFGLADRLRQIDQAAMERFRNG